MDKIKATNVDFYYGNFHALKNISLTIPENQVVAFIGPSGCGKSTFLRLFNRMNDLIPNTRLTGNISIDGQDIYDKSVEVDVLRRNVGMVFQRPNPFPKASSRMWPMVCMSTGSKTKNTFHTKWKKP